MTFPELLVKHAQEGDAAAMEQLCRRVIAFARTVISRSGIDPVTADDLSQESVMRVLKALPRLRHRNRFGYLVVRSITNVLTDFRRKQSTASRIRCIPPNQLAAVSVYDPAETERANELKESLVCAVWRLPGGLRRFFFLWRIERTPTARIASILDVSISTVKRLKAEIMRRLTRAVEGRRADHANGDTAR